MRKKIFTFLLALTASIGMMWAETVVVINKSEFTSSGVTKEGVTLALSSGSMTSSDPLAMEGSFKFSTSLGKFTGITIETDINIMQIYEGEYTSAGWPTGQNLGTSAVWTGESDTVLISCMVAGMNITITCTIEPAPATVNVATNQNPLSPSMHYSTFFHSTKNYALTGDGTQAFIAKINGGDFVLTKIADGTQVIPANTAVIFCKSGSSDPIVLSPTDEAGVSVNPENNSLRGVDEATTLESLSIDQNNCYVLSGTAEHGVGFYKINTTTLLAHKAYYAHVAAGAPPRRIRFVYSEANEATGLENVQGDNVQSTKVLEDGVIYIEKNGVRYNAQGQIVK